MATEPPVGPMARSPGPTSTSTADERSSPASPGFAYAGRRASGSSRLNSRRMAALRLPVAGSPGAPVGPFQRHGVLVVRPGPDPEVPAVVVGDVADVGVAHLRAGHPSEVQNDAGFVTPSR